MRFLKRTPAPDATSDNAIVNLYKLSRNPHDIAPLYKKYRKRLFFFCMNYLSNTEDCYDSVIEIFILIINDLKKQEVQNFESWLFAVARHYCLNKKRKNARFDYTSLDDDVLSFTEQDNFEETYLENQTELTIKKSLARAINNLDEKQALCVKLFYYDEKSYKEIARKTGFSLQQVKSYIQNGKRNLKIMLRSRNGVTHERV